MANAPVAPAANNGPKTVNVSFVVFRDGNSQSQNFGAIGYPTFVALQAALNGVITTLQSWGAIRVASETDASLVTLPDSGDGDFSATLVADHGHGTSRVSVSYTGVSDAVASQLESLFNSAVAPFVKG